MLTSIATICVCTLTGCLDTISGGEGGISGGSGLDDDRREIVQRYEKAVVARNDAVRARDGGINDFNNEEYDDAVGSIETALAEFEEGQSGFANAADLATELAEEEAASICEASAQETAIQVDATEAALAAATAAEEGADASTINGHVEEFQEVEAQADALTVEDTEVLAEVLGVQ